MLVLLLIFMLNSFRGMLAIIIPFYKITFFDETMRSLSGQTDQRFTVYIGDDGSPDDCREILLKHSRLLNIKYHRFETNLGGQSLVKHWERCYGLIGDEAWVMFLGDDDVLGENCVEEFHKRVPEVAHLGINVIRFSSKIINETSASISHHYTFPTVESSTKAYINKAKRKSRASLTEHIFRRKAFEQAGFIDMPEAWHTDDLLILDVSGYRSIYTINNAQVLVRYSGESVSGNQGNVEGKNRATLLFLRFLIGFKMEHFTKCERFYIIWYYFKKLKNFRQLSLRGIYEVVGFYLKNIFNSRTFMNNPVALR